jgi:hypothetical protein
LEPEEEDHERANDRKRAKDRARAADGAAAVLKMLRPFVARAVDRTGDTALKNAFNAALGSVKKPSRPYTGGYGAFAASARARDKAPRNPNPERARTGDGQDPDKIAKLQALYNAAHNKGGK